MDIKNISKESLKILEQVLSAEVCDYNNNHDENGRFTSGSNSNNSSSSGGSTAKVGQYKSKANLALKRIKAGMPTLNQQVLRATTYAYGFGKVSEEAIKSMSDEKKQKFVDRAMKQFTKMSNAKNDGEIDKAQNALDKYKDGFNVAERKIDRQNNKTAKEIDKKWKQRLRDPRWLQSEVKKYYAGKESGSFTGD